MLPVGKHRSRSAWCRCERNHQRALERSSQKTTGRFFPSCPQRALGGLEFVRSIAPDPVAPPFPELSKVERFVGPEDGYRTADISSRPTPVQSLPVLRPSRLDDPSTSYAARVLCRPEISLCFFAVP